MYRTKRNVEKFKETFRMGLNKRETWEQRFDVNKSMIGNKECYVI